MRDPNQPNKALPAPLPVPDFKDAAKVLNILKDDGELTDGIASQLISSNFAMHPSSQQSLEAVGHETSKQSTAQGIISSLAALPYLPEAANVLAASPEMLQLATLAGSPEVLAAAGIKMSAPALTGVAKNVTPLVHGAGDLVEATTEEVAEAAVVRAQVAGVLGENGIKTFVSGSTLAAKAGGKVLASTIGAGGAIIGGGLGFVGGLVAGRLGHKDKTTTATHI